MSKRSLAIEVNGLELENPFLIASGPPSANARTIARCYDAGWGGVVTKTTTLTDNHIRNVTPRYGKLHAARSGEVIGFENIELISDRPFEDWEVDFRQIKESYPREILVASIMERFDETRWKELTRRSAAAGVDAFELNFSCPHGTVEKGMGSVMGQVPEMVETVVRWVKEVTDRPVWAKLTPNITDIRLPGKAAFAGGADGLTAINTILAIIGIDLETLRPLPTVEGHSILGGYSAQAIKPIGLRMVQELAADNPGREISGVGGVWRSGDAIEYLLVGASTVQVCTGAMLQGYDMIAELREGLRKFMVDHHFDSVRSFVGASLPFFTTHEHLLHLQRTNRLARKTHGEDSQWGEDRIQDMTSRMTSNE
jgi:dihydroorotate dehydrogenase subfamily 1